MNRARRRVSRVALDAEDEPGVRQDELKRALDTGVEAPLAPALLEEAQQRLKVRVGDRMAVGAPRKGRDDGPRARAFRRGAVGPARKHAPAAGRLARTGAVEGARDQDRIDVRPARPIQSIGGTAQERLQPHGVERRQIVHERHGHVPRTGPHANANTQPLVNRIGSRRGARERGLQVGPSAHHRGVNAFAVDGHRELARVLEPAHHPEVRPKEPDRELVLPIGRKRVSNQTASDSPQRHPFDVLILGSILGHAIRMRLRAQLGVANGQSADSIGGRKISLLEHRREAQDVGNVVEPESGIVGRKQRRRVDVQVEEIANGVGVLGPVEPPQDGPSGTGLARGRTIQVRLEGRDQSVVDCVGGPRHAQRRHGASPQFAHDSLPDVGAASDVPHVEPVQRQPTRLHAGVVAGNAVALEHGLMCAGGHGLRGWTTVLVLGSQQARRHTPEPHPDRRHHHDVPRHRLRGSSRWTAMRLQTRISYSLRGHSGRREPPAASVSEPSGGPSVVSPK
jgi:hypothetical protein